MRTVYKSSIVGWGFFATAFIAGMHFFPEISSYRRFNFGETYINNDLGVCWKLKCIIFRGLL